MIEQADVSVVNSRSECNIYDENEMLPLMTAPMFSVVNEDNCKVFLDNKVQVCLPRKNSYTTYDFNDKRFIAISLENFIALFIDCKEIFVLANKVKYVLIDTANGNMLQLHDAIRKAKEIHGDNLIIMAGNVANISAFIKLAETGCDYIRVGIGGGGACSTTSNVGVGQKNLAKLVHECRTKIGYSQYAVKKYDEEGANWFTNHGVLKVDIPELYNNNLAVSKVKIVADGISSYINYCQKKYGYNDNGYAAINKLLDSGADIVMIGKLFSQCVESAGEKKIDSLLFNINDTENPHKSWVVNYSGMSTHKEQENYKDSKSPSEGSVQWIPVRWTLNDWLYGNNKQDEYPYLMGYANSLRSMMSYTDSLTLNDI